MRSKVKMPATVDAAVERLGELSAVMTATGWELAAILAAFVESDQGRRTDLSRSGKVTAAEFARLGIRGLSSPTTVLRYVNLWMEHAGTRPKPDRVVWLPDLPFPPEERNLGSRATASNIPTLIRTDPAIAAATTDAIADVLPTLPAENHERIISAVERLERQPAPTRLKSDPSLDDEWADWLNDANGLFITGASLAERSEQPGIKLGVHAAAALYVYHGMTERRIDAEFHQLMKDQGIER